jgi:hypothetical protein
MIFPFFRKARSSDESFAAATRLFIPKDAAAVAVGADDVAVAFAKGAAAAAPDPPYLRPLRRHRSAVAGGLPRPRRLQGT